MSFLVLSSSECIEVLIVFVKAKLLHGVRSGMAVNIALKPPGQFDFSKPDEWPKWKKRFQQYRSASGLDAESEPRQVDTLLYCLGEEADSVPNISSANRKKYDRVMEKGID